LFSFSGNLLVQIQAESRISSTGDNVQNQVEKLSNRNVYLDVHHAPSLKAEVHATKSSITHHGKVHKSHHNNKKKSKKRSRTSISKQPKPSDEEKFLRGFFDEVKGLKNDDDDEVYELSKTLHSQSFYKALKKKKIPLIYNTKRLQQRQEDNTKKNSVGKKKTSKYVQAEVKSASTLVKNLTAVVAGNKRNALGFFPYLDNNTRKSNVSVAFVYPKNESSEQLDIAGKAKKTTVVSVGRGNATMVKNSKHNAIETSMHHQTSHVGDEDSTNKKKTAIEREMKFLKTLGQDGKGRLSGLAKSTKRENVTVHNSVQSSAKLGKRHNILPLAHNIGHLQPVTKRENISVHNSVKSSAVLGGSVTLGKRNRIAHHPLLAEGSIYTNKLDNQTGGKKMKISRKPQDSLGSYQSLHQNVARAHQNTSNTSLRKRSQVSYEELKKANLNRGYQFTKRENVSVHNAVQSSAKLDGLKLGKRNQIDNHPTLEMSKKHGNISVHNSLKSRDSLRTKITSVGNSNNTVVSHPLLAAISRHEIHQPSSPTALPVVNNVKKKGILEERARRKSKASSVQSKYQQDHQPDLQEQMEMFNKLTSESSGSNELFQEDQSIKKSQKVSPSLSNVDKIDQVLAHGVHQTKKSVSSHTIPSRNVFNSTSPHLQTQKIVSNGVERSASSIPTIKSSIGPIGHESRMFGTDKIIRRMTNQERVYQTLAKGASNNSPQQQRRNTMINANMIHNVRNSTIGQIPRTKKNIVSQEPVHQPDTSPAQQKKNVVINSKIVGAVRNPTTEQIRTSFQITKT